MADHGVTLDLLAQICEQFAAVAPTLADPDMAINNLERFVAASRNPLATAALFERDPDALPTLLQIFATSQYLSDLLGRRSGSLRPAADDRRPARRPATRSSKNSSPKFARVEQRRRSDRRRCGGSSAAKRCASPTATSSAISRSKRSSGRFPTWPMRSSKPPSISPAASSNEQYGMPRRADGERSRFVVLGLGKLGGGELNYSSDIDLIFLYEQDGQTDARRTVTNHEFFERLAQEVIRLLTEADRAGLGLSRRPAAAARGRARPALHELRQHALVLRRARPHLGAAGVRQGPADRRRPRSGPRVARRGSSRGSIAAISAWPTSPASRRSSGASSSAPSAKAASCAT